MKAWTLGGVLALTIMLLASCGGGGSGGGSGGGGSGGSDGGADAGVAGRGDAPGPQFPPSSIYAQQCAPTDMLASAEQRTGSLDIEKKWLRSYMDEAYLWFDQVPSVDARLPQYSDTNDAAASMDAYFNALLTPQRTPSGKYVDQFSFTMPTADFAALAQQGADVGYGVLWTVSYQPNAAVVGWVVPGSQAERAGVKRGDKLVAVDGTAIGSLDPNAFYDNIFPAAAGAAHRLKFERVEGGDGTEVMLSAELFTLPPVPIVEAFPTSSGTVGYVLFNQHDAPAEAALIDAVNKLKGVGATDLVLDLRYNHGGYLYVASELAYMIAGPSRTRGRVFEKLNYNAKRAADNALPATPFQDTTCMADSVTMECTSQHSLPTLGLGRVYILATDSTCSASESIINGLRGVDVDVRIIGSTTCGKPYGFAGRDNCGTSYFPMEFKGTNAKGFGDYADGFAPDCAASDDLTRALGSADEGLLATALAYRESGACVARAGSAMARRTAASGRLSAAVAHGPLRGLRIHDAVQR